MPISITERLKPYSHTPGVSTLLPGSFFQIQIYPCLLRVFCLKKSDPLLLGEFSLDLKGLVEEFTVLNDLEKGCLTVWGKTKTGFIRYHLWSHLDGKNVFFYVDKAPHAGVTIHIGKEDRLVKDKTGLFLLGDATDFNIPSIPVMDRLSLGNHKAQDWDLVRRRLDLTEILPIWHRLGQWIPSFPKPAKMEGTLKLLEECRTGIQKNKPEKLKELWIQTFLGAFHHLLVPRLQDTDFQGFLPFQELSVKDLSPLSLLTEGSYLIRQQFIQNQHQCLCILPSLPPEFHSGRLVQTPVEGGTIDLEWTKKTVRRLVLKTTMDKEWNFIFKKVRSFRLRKGIQDRGSNVSTTAPIFLEKNCHYLFDNFK